MIKRCPQTRIFQGKSIVSAALRVQLLLDETKTEQLGRLVAGGLRHFRVDLGTGDGLSRLGGLNKTGTGGTKQAPLGQQRIGDRGLVESVQSRDMKSE